jgi:uncharacterized protein (DUF1330 family)
LAGQVLAPYEERFLVHRVAADTREGDFVGDLIVIEFPDHKHDASSYESAACTGIAWLRTENSQGWVILIDGVANDRRAADILDAAPSTN